MIDVFQAIVLGLIQGVTEWLPVSSSGHLALYHQFTGIGTNIPFDIALHVASLFVVLVIFRKEVVSVLKALVRTDFRSEEGRLALFVIAGTIPTAIIGFGFKGFFESMFYYPPAVGGALLVTGFILLLTRKEFKTKTLDFKRSLIVGAAQGMAVAPGISRSGATISASLLSGISREKAVRFSFLLFIPAIIGASLFSLNDMGTFAADLLPLAVGMIVAFASGYAAARAVIKLVINKKFHWFSLYCFALGLLVILLA